MRSIIILMVFVLGGCGTLFYTGDDFTNAYRVTYDANGGSGDVPVDGSLYKAGDIVRVAGTSATLMYSGYIFSGWSPYQSGGGVLYSAGDTFIMNPQDITLFAQWASETIVENPTFSPNPGEYFGSLTVSISSLTTDAEIWYTTNGTTPASGIGYLYTGAITISSSVTFRAVAVKTGMTDSGVVDAVYTFPWKVLDTAGVNPWKHIALSADGSCMVAGAATGYLSTSTDYGLHWNPATTIGAKLWDGVAISDTGTRMAAVVNGGYLYVSADSGATWPAVTVSRWWSAVACSADGMIIYGTAESFGNIIHKSIDGGANWTTVSITGATYLHHIRTSADGQRLICPAHDSYLYISQNGGSSWTRLDSLGTAIWKVASSSDGTVLGAIKVLSGNLYISEDGGTTWEERTPADVSSLYSIDLSGDGQKIVVAQMGGYIHTSENKGNSWRRHDIIGSQDWRWSAFSRDGQKIAAVVYNGSIYQYSY